MHTKYWLQNLIGRTPFEDSGTDRRVIGGDADKPLARPTPRCRRTESIVSLQKRVSSCAELQVFSCYRG